VKLEGYTAPSGREKKDSEVRLQEGHRSQVPAVISSNVFYILPRSLLSALFSVGL